MHALIPLAEDAIVAEDAILAEDAVVDFALLKTCSVCPLCNHEPEFVKLEKTEKYGNLD